MLTNIGLLRTVQNLIFTYKFYKELYVFRQCVKTQNLEPWVLRMCNNKEKVRFVVETRTYSAWLRLNRLSPKWRQRNLNHERVYVLMSRCSPYLFPCSFQSRLSCFFPFLFNLTFVLFLWVFTLLILFSSCLVLLA